MFKKVGYFTAIVLLVVAATPSITPTVRAAIDSCSAESTPQTVGPNTETNFNVRIINSSANNIQWITITRPSGNFTISSSSLAGWDSSTTANNTVLTGGSLNAGGQLTTNVTAVAANIEAPQANWSVQASDDPNGANPSNCNGSLGVTISNGNAPLINNISVTNLTSVSATITWITDEPATSQVNYGPTDDYTDSSDSDATLTTSHSATITGLLANTGYHYQVFSNDGAGNGTSSGDNTFLTSTAPTVVPSTTPTVVPSTTPAVVPSATPVVVPSTTPTAQVININAPVKTEIPLKATPTEKVPPTISLSTIFDKPFKQAPIITGQASDNEALAGIEYSIDGGQNWLPVDKTTGPGGKTAAFSFTPPNLDDGNYPLIARAIDTSGNVGYTPVADLVIDRLPPIVGGSLLSVGPQVLSPDGAAAITALVGIDQKITLSAIGGPISINLLAQRAGSSTGTSIFTLTKSADSGLWSGVLGFSKPGDYTLQADALDGAGNRTQRDLAKVSVMAPPQLLAKSSSGQDTPVDKAWLTLYYLAPETNSWVVWDGAPFSQNNPQRTKADGNFRYLLPAGTYYLKAEAKGYRTLVTKRFTLERPQPLTTSLHLKKSFGLKLGSFSISLPSLLWPSLVEAPTPRGGASQTPAVPKLVGTILPQFTLPGVTSGQLNSIELLGKPTVLSLMATWSPPSQEQLAAIAQLQANPDINVVPIATLQSPQQVAVYLKTAGFVLNAFVDADGTLVDKLALYNLPTHYFIDRKGAVKKVMVGVLSKQQLLEQIASP
ncbi:MAG: fibronectin type III domain-containing protein [Patescibacteria group bacterium]